MNFSLMNTLRVLKPSLFLLTSLSLGLHSVSLYGQDDFNRTRLVFDITPITDQILPLRTPVADTDESDERYQQLLNSITRYQDEIESLQQQTNNPYNFEFLEFYQSIGDANQQLGRHEEAILQYDNALQVIKVQNGLHTMDQLPLIEKIIQSYIAMGDMENATRWEEYVRYMHQQNFAPGSPEMVAATNTLADWYISSFFMQNFQSSNRGLEIMLGTLPEGERIANPAVGEELLWGGAENTMRLSNRTPFTYIDPTMEAIFNGDIRDLTPRDVEDIRLLTVARLYENSQHDIIASEEPRLDSIAQIARRIAGLSYITKQEIEYETYNNSNISNYEGSRIQEFRLSQERLDHSYDSGRNALRYIVNLIESVEGNPRTLASAQIELADWHLAYGKIQAARSAYEDAYATLRALNFSDQQIDASLNLEVPRQIPRSATHLYTRRSAGLPLNAELDYRGYIDVSFTLDRLGNPSDISFSSNDRPESRQIESVISNQLRTAKFRPHFHDGELVEQGRVDLRYYYSY